MLCGEANSNLKKAKRTMEHEQIKVNGTYYLVSIAERNELRNLHANLYGSYTDEDYNEFQKRLREIVKASSKQHIQFEDDDYTMDEVLPF